MLKNICIGIASLGLGSAIIAAPALARMDLDFAEDVGGTAYEWYVNEIKLNFDLEARDGVLPAPDGRPYRKFSGQDYSPQGHCLQVSFQPGEFPPPYMEVAVNVGGTYYRKTLSFDGAYPTIRIWLDYNNIGAAPYMRWAVYVLPDLGNTGFWGDIDMVVRRLELTKASCTSGRIDGVDLPWVSFEGAQGTGTTTITRGNGW
jgi:hypothetical protein